MSTIGAGLADALIDPVSATVAGKLSAEEEGALVTLMIVDASWTRRSFIFEVTTGASNIEVRAAS